MMIGNNVENIQAYTELYCLLKYFPKEYIKKLPEKLVKFFTENSKDEFKIKIDYRTDLKNQKLSKKTYDLLAVLKYNYWSTESEKEEIRKKIKENEILFQKELSEKYNPDNLFKNKTKEPEIIQETNVSMIEYKETIFTKIMNKIKRIFKRY